CNQHQWRGQENCQTAKQQRKQPLIYPQTGWNVEPGRKKQPAQAQRLEGNLAGDRFVVFRTVLDLDAACFELQQLFDFEATASVTHGDDDFVNSLSLNQVGKIGIIVGGNTGNRAGAPNEAGNADSQFWTASHLLDQRLS